MINRLLRVLKALSHGVYHICVDPCDGCIREGKCEMFNENGIYCGDIGFSFYEAKKKGGEE
jgi:hypothetical protein